MDVNTWCAGFSPPVDDPYWFWGHLLKGQGHGNLQLKNGFLSITKECLCWGTSYLVCRLVQTSKWPLLNLFDFEVTRSNVEGHGNLQLKNVFYSIIQERLYPGSSYLVCSLVLTCRWSLLIWMSVGQRFRSRWPLAEKWFPLNNWRLLGPRNFILGVHVGHQQQMSPIDFEVTRSKTKVMVTLSWKMVSAQ